MKARRLPGNPLLTPGSDPTLGHNINGPSVIRKPVWVTGLPGRYLLYFAHHSGKFIRLAYADEPGGPWTVYSLGVLPVENTPFTDHLASPDVHIDWAEQGLVMYFHGAGGHLQAPGIEQPTLQATSRDGLHWEVVPTPPLAESYLRLFHIRDVAYGISKSGQLYRGTDGRLFPLAFARRRMPLDFSGRHWAIQALPEKEQIRVFYSRWGDLPEHLLTATIDIRGDWQEWRIQSRESLLFPETEWEGARAEMHVSLLGSVDYPVCELRDPAYFRDDDGRHYLFYSIAGEQGLAAAELQD